MGMTTTWPTTCTINAWTGERPASGNISAKAKAWVLRANLPRRHALLEVPPPLNPADWRNPRVGWGLILLEDERLNLSQDALATAADAPEPIQALLKARGNAPVFRYRPMSENRFTLLRNYASKKDVDISSAPRGLAPDALPQYLLIYGSPSQIPWDLQYILNSTLDCSVGRLDLEGDALEHYVQALLSDWKDASSQVDQAVAWSADFGGNDISHLMRDAIAAEVYTTWQQDTTLRDKALFFDGSASATPASSAALYTALSTKKPALIVTTSHGQTGPLSDVATMKLKLGIPVDQNFQALDPEQLLAAWEPDGAIWYAHACCSAGSNANSLYGCLGMGTNNTPICLVEAGSPIDHVLKGVAGLGSLVAPLPRALLGAKKPLRAFIGHIEPTFDWTIQQPATGQFLTDRLRKVLYDNIYAAQPVGLAFRDYYEPLGALNIEYNEALDAYRKGAGSQEEADILHSLLYCQLAARDIQSMVILGDPTATLPPLP